MVRDGFASELLMVACDARRPRIDSAGLELDVVDDARGGDRACAASFACSQGAHRVLFLSLRIAVFFSFFFVGVI